MSQATTSFKFKLVTLGILLLFEMSFAGITGKIAGRVIDAGSGQALVGTQIIVQGTTRGTTTDPKGSYIMINVPPGSYSLTFMMMGYEKKIVQNVRVSSDYTTTIDVALNQTVIEGQTVTVTAERPLIQKDLTSTAVAIAEARMTIIPTDPFKVRPIGAT